MRSATAEEVYAEAEGRSVRGNPAQVSPPASLEGAWIEVFRAGDYGERGRWSPQQLDQLAAAYDPRLHAAPVVLGHPTDDAPAYAWVRRLRRAGQSLWAQLEKVDPLFEALLRAGRFAQRSVALYTHFPATGGPYLRHLGFLGAAPPAVKGLAPVRFADAASITFAFDEQLSEVEMSEPKSKLESFLDHLRAFFAPQDSSPTVIPPAPSVAEGSASEGSAFAERLAALEQRFEVLTTSKGAPDNQPSPEGVLRTRAQFPAFVESRSSSRAEARDARELIANFVESQRSRGRFPPAFERWGVREFMERLADADAALPNTLSFRAEPVHGEPVQGEPEGRSRGTCFSTSRSLAALGMTDEEESGETGQGEKHPASPTLLAWFQEFLTKLPAVIEFGELAPQSGATLRSPQGVGGSRLVHFTEPRRGMVVDPASVELAERAEALAAELGIPYAEALTRLREESRHRVTSA